MQRFFLSIFFCVRQISHEGQLFFSKDASTKTLVQYGKWLNSGLTWLNSGLTEW
jgi:hypothetical protein